MARILELERGATPAVREPHVGRTGHRVFGGRCRVMFALAVKLQGHPVRRDGGKDVAKPEVR